MRVPTCLLLIVLSTGCVGNAPSEPAASPTGPLPSQVVTSQDPHVGLAEMLHARGVEIWFEADLVARWLEGPQAFDTAVERLGRLAEVPGFAGFKIADEIGYDDGLSTPARVRQFLKATRLALDRAAPESKLLVDAIVPELGCLPWAGSAQRACARAARLSHPATTIAATGDYLREGLVDRLDLSTGLLDPDTYADWGLSRKEAQAQAWAKVVRKGWPNLTVLQARKALADADGYQGGPADAADDVETFLDVPTAAGAEAIDVWTWRQPYSGGTYSLLGPDLSPNPLWTALKKQRRAGVHLFTHMTPTEMPTEPSSYAHECDLAAGVFTSVFVAAGTG